MNKTDLFQEKILHSGRHLRMYLSSYKGKLEGIVSLFFFDFSCVNMFGCNISVSSNST